MNFPPFLRTVVIILVASFAWTIYKNERRASQQLESNSDKQYLTNGRASLNRGLPTMLDSETMMTRVDADSSSTIYYVKMINYPSTQLDHSFLSQALELVGRRNCADSDIRWYFDQGKHMKYIVMGSDDRQVGSFIVSKTYCERFH